jgi:uncharacterized membrane protein
MREALVRPAAFRFAIWPGLAVIAAVAASLRLFHLNHESAWVDEAFTIHAAAGSWRDLLGQLVTDYQHPPLHTALVKIWFSVAGVGVPQARWPSAVAGILAVPAVYWLGLKTYDRRAASLAAVLLAISQLGVLYSQEARAYSLLLLLTVLAAVAFLEAFRTGQARAFGALVFLTCLLIYTHYYGALSIAGLVLYALLRRRQSRVPGWWWIIGAGVVVVAYLPWLMSGVIAAAQRNPSAARVHGVAVQILSPVYALNWFNNGKIAGVREPAPWWTLAAGCLLLTVPALIAIGRGLRDEDESRDETLLLVLLCVVPVVGVTAVGVLHVVYDVRHVSFAIAPYYLLVARGLTLIRPRAFAGIAVAGIVVWSSVALHATYTVPFKENYRDAFARLVADAQVGDCTVYGAPDDRSRADWYWTAYYIDRPPPLLVGLHQVAMHPECRRVWLLWDKNFWKSGPLSYEDAVRQLGPYEAGPRWPFLGVDLQVFTRVR